MNIYSIGVVLSLVTVAAILASTDFCTLQFILKQPQRLLLQPVLQLQLSTSRIASGAGGWLIHLISIFSCPYTIQLCPLQLPTAGKAWRACFQM